MRGDREARIVVHDAMRRLEYNLHQLLNAADQPVDNKHRSRDEVRIFAYTNFLSSIYSLQDIIRAYFKHIDCKQDFVDKVEAALDDDELMNYVRESRNTQDHSLKPAAFCPILPYISLTNPNRVIRGEPELRDLVVKQGSKKIPIPKTFLGRPIGPATLEVVAQNSYQWWVMFINGLKHETFAIPEPYKPE